MYRLLFRTFHECVPMPNDKIDASPLSTDPFHLADEAKITIHRHRFQNFGSYQSDVVVSGNTISGGGTRSYERITWGYRIKVENVGNESRRYFFEWEIFSDDAKTVLRKREKITTDVLRPGQITYVSIDTRAGLEDELRRTLITRAQLVKEKDNVYMVQTKDIWDLWTKTKDLEITGALSETARFRRTTSSGCLAIIILFGLFVGMLLLVALFSHL